jgi:peptide/nickel transport system substrate-binding protein
MGYSNPDVDNMLEQTRATADQEERGRLFREVQATTANDVAYAFLYHTPDVVAFKNDVMGYVPVPEMRYMETMWLDR